MNKRSAAHPDHPDLARLTDSQLDREQEYTFRAANTAAARLLNAMAVLRSCRAPEPPMWALREDLSIHTDRFEAIMDEIRFRNDSMR